VVVEADGLEEHPVRRGYLPELLLALAVVLGDDLRARDGDEVGPALVCGR
jgi:hypothetical protein